MKSTTNIRTMSSSIRATYANTWPNYTQPNRRIIKTRTGSLNVRNSTKHLIALGKNIPSIEPCDATFVE